MKAIFEIPDTTKAMVMTIFCDETKEFKMYTITVPTNEIEDGKTYSIPQKDAEKE